MDEKRFYYDWYHMLLPCQAAAATSIITTILVYAALFERPDNAIQLTALYSLLIIFALGAIYSLNYLRNISIVIDAGDDGIIIYKNKKELFRVLWKDVSYIEFSILRGGLRIKGKNDKKSYFIPEKLVSFADLRKLAREKTASNVQ